MSTILLFWTHATFRINKNHMFKKFSVKENVSSTSQIKSSLQRGIRSDILQQYPALEPCIEDILPKKKQLMISKCANHINVVLVDNVPLFYQIREGPYFPTLRLLHKYPFMMPQFRVDRGAIKFVLGGANIMCPGLTSKGGSLVDVPQGCAVAVMAEGKQHALAIGLTLMSTVDIRKVNKGHGVEVLHYLGDGLWHTPQFD